MGGNQPLRIIEGETFKDNIQADETGTRAAV